MLQVWRKKEGAGIRNKEEQRDDEGDSKQRKRECTNGLREKRVKNTQRKASKRVIEPPVSPLSLSLMRF